MTEPRERYFRRCHVCDKLFKPKNRTIGVCSDTCNKNHRGRLLLRMATISEEYEDVFVEMVASQDWPKEDRKDIFKREGKLNSEKIKIMKELCIYTYAGEEGEKNGMEEKLVCKVSE